MVKWIEENCLILMLFISNCKKMPGMPSLKRAKSVDVNNYCLSEKNCFKTYIRYDTIY